MRRVSLFLLVLFQIFLFQACGEAPYKAEDIVFSFSCKVECKSGDVSTICSVERPGIGLLSCTVLSPSELSGMNYHWDGQNFTITYSGICAKSDTCPLPSNNFALLLKKILDYASRSEVLASGKGGVFTGSFENMPFTIQVDQKTGEIQKISIPQKDFTACFYEYKEQGTS